jgi:hypothetical protein
MNFITKRKKVSPDYNLLICRPDLAREFHLIKNKPLTPNMITPKSHKKIWWHCEKGHEWEAVVANRFTWSGCPACSGRVVSADNNLAVKCPDLASEWHPTKNGVLTPWDVTSRSNKKVWWLCEEGHEWESVVNNRFNWSGCPACSSRKLSAENNFATKCPHLILEWHPSKNGKLTPWDVFSRGGVKVWWQCEKGHEWEATTGNRYAGNKCPFCDGRKTTGENNLTITHPLVVLQWNYEKNCGLRPEKVKSGSSRKVWWRCEKGHEWETPIKHMVNSQKCPYCIGRRVSKENNFAAKCPHLLNEWDDKEISPYEVTSGSSKIVSWKCKFGHIWKAAISSRTRGHGCPKCSFQSSRLEVRIYCELKQFFPDTLWQTKIEKREVDVFIPSHSLGIEVDGYWHSSPSTMRADAQKTNLLKRNGINLIRVMDDRLQKHEDSICLFYKNGECERSVVVRLLELLKTKLSLSSDETNAINKYLVTNHYINEDKYNKIMSSLPAPRVEDSVLGHDRLVKEWNYDKNLLPPSHYSYGSKVKVWWICKYKHEWKTTPNSRSRGTNCPYCCKKKASPENNLLVCKPDLAHEFHLIKNTPLTPEMITPRSGKKVWWLCKKGHEWQAVVGNRYLGSGCPVCNGKSASGSYSLGIKYPDIIPQWQVEKNFPLTPFDVLPRSNKKVWWICQKGHEWLTSVEKRTRGHGCHVCNGYAR